MYIKATYNINIFIAYHPADREMFDELYTHLLELDQSNKGYLINKVWYDGSDLTIDGQKTIRELSEMADLVLLLLSESSIISPYFSGKALRSTLNLHRSGRSIVVPIILNTCWWEDTAYKELEVLPRAGLPIYDSINVKNELFDQVVGDLDLQIEKIRTKKIELEESFKALLQEAEAIFVNWDEQPEKLRTALPLYKEALDHWREGFVPHRALLEARIDLCLREIDFRHYSKAANEAYEIGDYQTTYFNCKDALGLRNDAVMRKLFDEVSLYLREEELLILKKPFEQHLKIAQGFFLNLEWEKAKKEFYIALEFHEEDFFPSREVIEHKMEICRREAILESSYQKSMEVYQSQNYALSVEVLLDAIKIVNRDAYTHIEHMIKLVGFLENVSRFHDKKSNRWGFYDEKNSHVIIAPKYLAAYDFSENLAAVKKWDKWGFIDIEGNEIIPFEYDFVGHFRAGVVEVIQGKETFFINHLGLRIESNEALHMQALKERPLKLSNRKLLE